MRRDHSNMSNCLTHRPLTFLTRAATEQERANSDRSNKTIIFTWVYAPEQENSSLPNHRSYVPLQIPLESIR
jgi:hypothetical protein